MKRLVMTLFLLAGVSAYAPTVHATIIAGVETIGDAPVPPEEGPAIERGSCDVFIDFDDVSAPCAFLETGPLRNEYAGQGVTFAGPDALGGGAILHECSNFGVAGHSSPNFLAFNNGAQMGNGGIPRTPETMTFSSAMSEVSILVGSGFDGSAVTLEGYNSSDVLVDSETVNLAANLQLLTVTGSGIVRAVLRGGSVFVADDLCLVHDEPTPTIESTWGLIKTVYR